MADLNQYGGAATPEERSGADMVPAGWRVLKVEREEVIKNDRGWVGLKVGSSDAETGLWVWDLFTLQHATSAKAVEIGRAKLGELAHACGFREPLTDSSQLLGQTYGGKVRHKDDDFSGGKVAECVAWKDADDVGSEPKTATTSAGNLEDIPF